MIVYLDLQVWIARLGGEKKKLDTSYNNHALQNGIAIGKIGYVALQIPAVITGEICLSSRCIACCTILL